MILSVFLEVRTAILNIKYMSTFLQRFKYVKLFVQPCLKILDNEYMKTFQAIQMKINWLLLNAIPW